MRRLLIGDIHGQYERMIDVLQRSGYDPEKDELYPLGDFCDRGPRVVDVINYIYSLPNCYPVIGNHDIYLMEYLMGHITTRSFCNWIREVNGGYITVDKIKDQSDEWKSSVSERLWSTPFIRKVDNNLIVHGGLELAVADTYTQKELIGIAPKDVFKDSRDIYDMFVLNVAWNRDFIREAMENKTKVETPWGLRVFVGHTPLRNENKAPFISEERNVIDIDTGSFVPEGCITVMDMDTLEYWQSDVPIEPVPSKDEFLSTKNPCKSN